ncbi:hypothetical protein OAU50_04980, partial [Planctomycetota bacterium]|nr:hypothetical protein [Planctomycetota bacterium]
FLMATHHDVQAEQNPNVKRAELAGKYAGLNNRKGALKVLEMILAEKDGPVGYAMSDAVALLKADECLKEIEKTLKKWREPKHVIPSYWILRGLAKQNSAEVDKLVIDLMSRTKPEHCHVQAAGFEALGDTGRADFLPVFHEMLDEWKDKKKRWVTKNPILALSLVSNIAKVVNAKDLDARNATVMKLADALAFTEPGRIQWFLIGALSKITSEPRHTSPHYWRFWAKTGGNKRKGEKAPDRETSDSFDDPPEFFNAPSVGNRIVYVIDISGSMTAEFIMPEADKKKPEDDEREITGEGKKKRKKANANDIPPRDYSKVKNRLDLAKVELIYSLKTLPEDYFFSIVVYDSRHKTIDSEGKFIQATKFNREKYAKLVDKLNPGSATNIHGALRRAFCINSVKEIDPLNASHPDSSWDTDCILSGATTIFFLTDGSPSGGDDMEDTIDTGRKDANGNPYRRSRYALTENILLDVKRMNLLRKTVIHAIGIGSGNNQLLKGLAEQTGGTYVARKGVRKKVPPPAKKPPAPPKK